MNKYLATSLILVAIIIGMGIGYFISPMYQSSMNMNEQLGQADDKYDLRFIDRMIEHHEGAIMMAEDAKEKSQRQEILDLAKEIEMLKSWRSEWYGDAPKTN
jgi:uncharacterized protein (DUF305 family)